VAYQVSVEIKVMDFGGELTREGKSGQSYAQRREIWQEISAPNIRQG